jgi:hypothetical protein
MILILLQCACACGHLGRPFGSSGTTIAKTTRKRSSLSCVWLGLHEWCGGCGCCCDCWWRVGSRRGCRHISVSNRMLIVDRMIIRHCRTRHHVNGVGSSDIRFCGHASLQFPFPFRRMRKRASLVVRLVIGELAHYFGLGFDE